MPQELPDQSASLISMTVDWGAMNPVRVTVREAMSEPYEIEVVAVHGADEDIPAEEILQDKACVTIRVAGNERCFHGVVRSYQPLGFMRTYRACRLTIVPRVWALGLANDCRVFQEKTAEDIIKDVLAVAGLTDVEFRITGDKPQLPYRTQYNESGLRFITRLMEEAGWFYFFEQTDQHEMLVITDDNASLADLGPLDAHDMLTSMRPAHGIARAKEHTRDYNPETPATDVKGEQATLLKATGLLSPPAFVWPAHGANPDEAAKRARLRMEAAEAASVLYAGSGRWPMLSPGHFFELDSDPFTRANDLPPGKYAVRSVQHQAIDEAWLNGGAVPEYGNSFEAFPYDTGWRQPLDTHKPHMDGVHAAIVIGGDGDVVHTDDLGRVKIRFFWDHRGDASADNGIWARVVQPWAGPGWGGQFIPRVGTEVAVAFMNGDPDHPVVLGGLYNGADAPIYDKASNTMSGFRTRSFAGSSGGAAEFSEFTFDDKQGEERIVLHAQKDFKVSVENDLDLKVDNCRIVKIKVDDTVGIDGKQTYTVKGDQSLKISEGNRSVVVSKGDQKTELGMGNYKLDVKQGNMDTTLGMGNFKLAAKMGAVTIEAMQSITLKVGSSTVVIDQMGVKINGMTLKMKADMSAEMEAGLELKLKGGLTTKLESGLMTSVKGVMTDVKGDGMLILKGGLTMIN